MNREELSDYGFSIIHLDTTDSTNAYAMTHIMDLAHHTVITADIQTRGRGRMERSWISDSPGNLYASIVIKPGMSPGDIPLANFTQLFSVLICDVLRGYGTRARIKWPNDVFINGKKCAGILSEASFDGGSFKGLVVGIGVNIADNPEERLRIKQPVTCLREETDRVVTRDDFLGRLLAAYASKYDSFCSGGFPSIRNEYLEYFDLMGRTISVMNSGHDGSATVIDVSCDGGLVLENASGDIITLVAGDIL
jgi:BirA family biotin operon repressor/biotin-[acetyl-CoA-carboxylase] ligase